MIVDFSGSEGDLIDLSDIDARQNRPDNQRFKYIGDKPFHGKAGELRFEDGLLQADTDGNGRPDLEISLPDTGNLRANDIDL
jgi:serralysin